MALARSREKSSLPIMSGRSLPTGLLDDLRKGKIVGRVVLVP